MGKIRIICLVSFSFLVMLLFSELLTVSPENAIKEFKESKDKAEDQIMDPLILCGKKVIPLVMKEIEDTNMPNRRYAIAYLGNAKSNESTPLLICLLNDTSQSDLIRGDALRAIASIDIERGKDLAKEFVDNEGYIGGIARNILSGDFSPVVRSFWDARLKRRN